MVGYVVHVSCPYFYQKNKTTYELPHWTSMLVFPGLIGAKIEVAIGEKKLGGIELESVRVGLSNPVGMTVSPQLVFADIHYRGLGSRASSLAESQSSRPSN